MSSLSDSGLFGKIQDAVGVIERPGFHGFNAAVEGRDDLLMQVAELRIATFVEQKRVQPDGDVHADARNYKVHIELRNVREQQRA